jgi:polyhydroxyalkanoate synthesis regulator phasin
MSLGRRNDVNIFNRERKDRETTTADQHQIGPKHQSGLDVAERAARFSTSFVEASIEAWRASTGLVFWQQDQAERMIRLWLDQGRISREQAQSLQATMAEQFRRNQADLQRMVLDAVQRSCSMMQHVQAAGVDELHQQFQQIGKQLDGAPREQQQ